MNYRVGVLAVLAGCFAVSSCRSADSPEAPPASVGLEVSRLSGLDGQIQAHLPHVRSVLVARRGRLVFEKYYGDASRDTLQNIQSMTKSISSALLGIALRKGYVTSLDNKVLDYLPEYRDIVTDPRVRDITVRQVLTMSSGIDATRELYLRNGRWAGREIVPASFVAESVKVHSTGDFFGETARYGYMWWIAKVGGYDAFYARGYGGQYLMVIPKLELVILCTSDWRHFALVEGFGLPAVVSK